MGKVLYTKCSMLLAMILVMSVIVSSKVVKHLKKNKDHHYGKNHRKVDVPAQKRQLWQFKNMIECATGRSTFDFVNYGKYCGWGGSGIPVDDLDRCCQVHDECYGDWKECRPKSNLYDYKLSGEHPQCNITCSHNPKNTECERAVCICDKLAAECFAKSHYNPEHKKPTFNFLGW
ncbi:basic phospholipase A2 pseudexin A chain-like [Actinia tenebrosa]|uniref:Phospholipase A2 n=1 Tax=Actinia tenebrosa TaxID=6105 RepID=A0A6P8HBI3_ACTTE|nr:basic phospholipase A2 pseudexin A chain-like [Actinia tenebrosa]